MRNRPKSCRVCGKGEREVGRVSWQGYCAEHGRERMEANVAALVSHSGAPFQHWRRRTLAAFGVSEVDAGRDAA